ncbi:hypothetical protein ACQ33O_05015 [Ferruginibacter sp. SUN002]|uniref:hypothetical protein n=1 Tax=Ferruginibacter sp. SUN002 TaxID=2937789 RepID=UPI003D35D218
MRSTAIISAFIVTSFSTNGQTPASDEILEKFKHIDSSLSRSNDILQSNILLNLYKQIKKGKNTAFTSEANKIYLAIENINTFIDNLKDTLTKYDSSGIQLDVAEKCIVQTAADSVLKNKLNSVYVACISLLPEEYQKLEIKKMFFASREFINAKNSESNYFIMAPTIGAITVLNSFKNNCKNIATYTLTEILSKSKK